MTPRFPSDPPVLLRPCDPAERDRRVARFVEHHVSDLARLPLAAPDQLMRFTRAMVLADCGDDAVPRHSHFFDIVDARTDTAVGYLWTTGQNFGFGTTLYLRHLLVDPPHRRQGFATAALRALARLTSDCAAVSGLALAVTAGNGAAERLYDRLGFRPFSRLMFLRTLPPGASET